MIEDTSSEGVTTRSKEARRRGSNPLELAGFRSVPKAHRVTKRNLLEEHRLEIIGEAKELGLAGATDFEVCQHLGISDFTLNRWKARDPQFRQALQISKDIADKRIEAALYHKAHGYSFASEEIKVINDEVVRVPTMTHVAPDTTAMIFWLKNRQRQDWTDVQRVELNANVNTDTDIKAVALAMLATIRAGLVEEPVKTIEHEENE